MKIKLLQCSVYSLYMPVTNPLHWFAIFVMASVVSAVPSHKLNYVL